MLLTLLERIAARRRGRGGGIWTGIAFATFLLRWHQKRVGKDAVTLREELRPGESLLITHGHQRQG